MNILEDNVKKLKILLEERNLIKERTIKTIKMQKNELNSLEVKELLRYVVNNNKKLAKEGKTPIAIEIEGMPGTAKTSVVKQLSKELNDHYVRLNLSEIEVCDLVGLPTYEYHVFNAKTKEEKWISDKVLAAFITMGWEATGNNRTSYAKPSWIQGKEDKPVLLVLDDYNRVTPMMTNACMTLIDEQKYVSWSLPEGSTIVLTCNPSDQDFMVQQEDSAQATRRLKINMKANVDIWASEFAEGYGVDGRCINFLLKHPEIIEGANEKGKNGETLAKGNLRIWTKYFDSISGIPDFNKELGLIMNLGMGSLPPEHVITFTQFVKNGLDKLASPEQLLKNDIKWSLGELKSVIKEGSHKRQDIAAIMTKRLLNFALANESSYTKGMVENYADILESGMLSVDLVIISLKKLCTKPKFKDLAIRPKLLSLLTT